MRKVEEESFFIRQHKKREASYRQQCLKNRNATQTTFDLWSQGVLYGALEELKDRLFDCLLVVKRFEAVIRLGNAPD